MIGGETRGAEKRKKLQQGRPLSPTAAGDNHRYCSHLTLADQIGRSRDVHFRSGFSRTNGSEVFVGVLIKRNWKECLEFGSQLHNGVHLTTLDRGTLVRRRFISRYKTGSLSDEDSAEDSLISHEANK